MNTPMIYPGDYNPPVSWRNGNHREYSSDITPECSVGIQDGLIEFSCWLPGARREDIQLTLRNHRLQLSVCSAVPVPGMNLFKTIRYHIDRSLPPLAETIWYTAEYKRGLLTLRFPITTDPMEQGITAVIVY